MPRYEYRNIAPTPPAQKAFLEWIDQLDAAFQNPDPDHRSDVVRDALHQIYLGRSYSEANAASPHGEQTLMHSFDPRNATGPLESV